MAKPILQMQENIFHNISEGFVLSRDTDGAHVECSASVVQSYWFIDSKQC
jgi:hypothetical protein